METYVCDRCGQCFEVIPPHEHRIRCAVSHPYGQCCHYGERRVNPATIKACPECGEEVWHSCYHDGEDIPSVWMSPDAAAELREESCETPFNDLGNEIVNWAETMGFNEMPPAEVMYKALRLLLIVSECAEVLEAMRKGTPEQEAEEVADIMIRILHYAADEGIDLDREVAKKMEKNRGRPYKHGKRF